MAACCSAALLLRLLLASNLFLFNNCEEAIIATGKGKGDGEGVPLPGDDGINSETLAGIAS